LLLEGLFVEKSSSPDEGAERWKRSGWQEALAYHRASQNLRFNRDAKNYLNAITKQLLRSERGEDYRQPGPFKGYFSDDVLPLGELGEGAPTSKITLYEVFRRTRPFRPYAPGPLRADQLVAIMRHTYGVDAECEGLLGPYFRRTTPSGGARHPIEAYVLVNEVCGVSAGLYHYAPLPHALRPLRYGDYRETLTQNCFDKPGIKTASVVIVLTVRWLRHMWKYRYAKSYRMVLMDVGHAIQTNLLNAHAVGVQCFPCPSIFDQGLEEFLGLRNPLDEGVIYAIGMGPAKPIEEGDTYFPEHQF